MRVAITGANGFIGSHLAEAYARAGHEVRALVRPGRALPPDALATDLLSTVAVDYEDARDLRRVLGDAELVVHVAGVTRAPPPARLGLMQTNVGVTRRLARVAAAVGTPRFVFISSQAAAGPARNPDRPVREIDSPSPVEAYGASKLEAERSVAEELRRERWSIVRPVAVYGPRERDFLALFRAVRVGVALHPGNRAQSIGIVHVNDLVRAIMAAGSAVAAAGKTYFIANAQPITWGELFGVAAAACDARIRMDLELPRILVDAIARGGDLHARITRTPGLLTTQKIALSKPRWWHCSTDAAARDLGFAAAIPLSDGLRQTYDWYRTAGWL